MQLLTSPTPSLLAEEQTAPSDEAAYAHHSVTGYLAAVCAQTPADQADVVQVRVGAFLSQTYTHTAFDTQTAGAVAVRGGHCSSG